MENAEGQNQPYTPHQHLHHILGHHVLAGSGRPVVSLEVKFQKSLGGLVDIVEDDIEYSHQEDGEDADPEVGRVDERTAVDAQGGIAQVEDICCPIDGKHDRCHSCNGQQYMVHKAVSARLCDRLFVQLVTTCISTEQSAEAGDGEDARQLHNPPYQQFYAQQCVARP